MKSNGNARWVMVVDDDWDMVKMFAGILSFLGVKVATAANGAEALSLFRERQGFELVLTDFQMPVMDGLTLASRIKAESPGTPVVLMTGALREEVERHPAVICVDQVLYKPFHLAEIQNALRCLASDRAIRASAATP